MSKIALSLCVVMAVSGCATIDRGPSALQGQRIDRAARPVLDAAIEREILVADKHLEEVGDMTPVAEIPVEINHKVRQWLQYFAKDRARFQRFLDRGEVYRPLIEKILRQESIPTEFYYLAMIESGFVVHATSHASAVGIWQFIPGTAKRFGLKKGSDVDERRDVVRATQAAAIYLRNLHAAFQSWYLAMAGYNAGEGRILRAVVNGGSRDFWELVRRKALPPETRNYVPKFLAALIIGRNPEKYGFRRPVATPFPEVEAAAIPARVPLAEVSRHSKLPVSTLKRLNPHLIRGRSPAQAQTYAIWVPKGYARRTLAASSAMKQLPKFESRRAPVRQVAKAKQSFHRVRRGETLSAISSRYNIKLASLKRINRLSSSRVRAGQRLRVSASSARKPRYIKYRVRPGEILSIIARRFEISVAALMKYNNLKSSRIYAGRHLKVPNPDI